MGSGKTGKVEDRLNSIVAVARRLSQPLELVDTLERIVNTGCHVLQADRASVLLYDQDAHELYSKVTTTGEQIRFDADSGIGGESLRERHAIRVADCYSDPRFNPEVDKKTGYRSRSLLTIPLIGLEETPVGVLQLLNSAKGAFSQEDERLAEMFAGFAAIAIQRAQNLEDRLRNAKLERDLALARDIQLKLLRQEIPQPKGYEIAVFSRPADETGGDIYDFEPYSTEPDGVKAEGEQGLLILLADATGHGISAALSVTQVRAMLRMALRSQTPFDDLCLHLNNQLVADLPQNRFVTAFLGILDPERHTVEYHALGQAPTLVIRHAANDWEKLGASSLPGGLMHQKQLERPEPIRLEKGDLVALLSDGFFEYGNPSGQELGAEGVADILLASRSKSAKEMLDALLAELDDFAQGAPQDDDLTAILVKRS